MSLARPSTALSRGYSFHFGAVKKPSLTRQQTKLRGKTFVVAVDGSEQAKGGLDLAAGLMRPGEDHVKIVTINVGVVDMAATGEAPITPMMHLDHAKADLMARGVPAAMIEKEAIDPEEMSIGEAIVKQTNFLRCGFGVLVLGATGKGAQKKVGDAGKGLGKVADYVLLHAKCPVALVKDKNVYGGMANSMRPSLNIICCVDGANVRATPTHTQRQRTPVNREAATQCPRLPRLTTPHCHCLPSPSPRRG